MAVRPSNALAVEIPEVVTEGLPQALRRNRWIVVASMLLGTGIGVATVCRSTPMFRSSAKLLFEHSFSDAPAPAPEPYVRAQAELLGSFPVLNDAVQKLGKQHLQTFGSSVDFYQILQQSLRIDAGKADGTLTVSFAGPVAGDSAVIVNTVVASYQAYRADQTKYTAHETLAALERQKSGISTDLADNMRKLQNFETANQAVDLDSAAEMEKQKLAKLNDQLIDAQAGVLTQNAKYESLVAEYGAPSTSPGATASAQPAAAVQVPANANVSAKTGLLSDDSEVDPSWIQNELNLASANLDMLKSRGLTDNDPSVQDARASVDRLSKKLAAYQRSSGIAVLAQARLDLDVASRRAAALQAEFDAQNKTVAALDAKRAERVNLQEAVHRSEKAVEDIDSQISQARQSDVAPMEIHLLDAAHPATAAEGRGYSAIAGAGGLGILVGFGLSLGMYAIDQRLRSPGAIRKLLRLPVLGVVPHVDGNPTVGICGTIVHSNSMSDFAEAARTVRSAIFFAGKSTAARTILVASANRGDGKSTFASNLAIAMAQCGSRTLLLDLNFRDPKTPEIFEIVRPTGLSDVLCGKLPLDRAIFRTRIEQLEVLTCGSVPRNPAELLNSGGFSRLIEQLTMRYQCVVLDSPPVLTGADARILGALADLTVFVVRAGSTRRNAADRALEHLLSVGARVLGAVINDVTLCKPIQRSRGMLRFVETTEHAPDDAGGQGLRHSDSIGTKTASEANSQRMESSMIADVEVLY